MPASMLLSVIVPIHDAAPHLEVCLESILDADENAFALLGVEPALLERYEVIAVDGSWQPGASEVLGPLSSRYPHLKTIAGVRGEAPACNAGFDASSGRYVAFIDPADAVYPTYLPRLLEWAAEDDADIYVFDEEVGISVPQILGVPHIIPADVRTPASSLKAFLERDGFPAWIWNKLYRRSLIGRAGLRFNEALGAWEGAEFHFAAFPLASVSRFSTDAIYLRRTRTFEPEDVPVTYMRACNGIDTFGVIISAWARDGLLEGRHGELLQCLAPLTRSAARLDGTRLAAAASRFGIIFEQYFDGDDLRGLPSYLRTWYQLLVQLPRTGEPISCSMSARIHAGAAAKDVSSHGGAAAARAIGSCIPVRLTRHIG